MSTATATPSTTSTWSIDAAHSHVGFAVKHLMITTVRGEFPDVSGTVVRDEADPSASRIDVQIAAASIDTREPQRDAHLRSADFLDVERFPLLTFTSRRVDGDLDGTFKIVGDLTIHGVTREVVLEATAEGLTIDPWGGQRSGFSAFTRINRAAFGLTWNQALETGGVLVSDEVRITLDVQLVRRKDV